MSQSSVDTTATASPLHPHEPDIPPALDPEGRCLVCQLLSDIIRLAQEAAEARAECNRLRAQVGDASRLLTPGMKAGVAEAKAILQEIVK